MNATFHIRDSNNIGTSLFTKIADGLPAIKQYSTQAVVALVAATALNLGAAGNSMAGTNATPWATQSGVQRSIDKGFQRNRQVQVANEAVGIVGEVRGLTPLQQRIARLASKTGGAFADPKNAAGTAAVLGLGTAILLPNNANATINQPHRVGSNNNTSQWESRSVRQQHNNQASNSMSMLYQAYKQNAQTLYSIAVDAHFKNMHDVRDEKIKLFGENWHLGTQAGLQLSRYQEDAAQFNTLRRMNESALQMGLNQALAVSQQQTQQVTYTILGPQ